MKKGGNFDHGCKKNRALLDFFLQPSVAFWLDFNQNFVLYRMNVISKALALLLIELWSFSPTTFKKVIFFLFFRQSDPPRNSQNAKMRNFCKGFYKMMMSTFKKITESQIWGNYFIMKNIGLLHNMLPSP